jgi:hypothetical protein
MPPLINYTARDWDTNVRALQDHIRSVAPDSWNSFFAGDLGQVLLELIAYDATMLSYVQDFQVQEGWLDTLNFRESLMHWVRYSGYNLRRATAVTMQAYARSASPPTDADVQYNIQKGTKIKSKDGQTWEIAEDVAILPGNFSPVSIESEWGQITGRTVDSNGVESVVVALVKIAVGSSTATLCNLDGSAFASNTPEATFGPSVNQGSILKLLNQYDNSTQVYTTPPDWTRDEFAIVDIGKADTDLYDRTILHLDRPWDGDTDFIGQWRIENRNVKIVQGETHIDTFTVPSDANRKSYTVSPAYYPVIAGGAEAFIPAGSTQFPSDANIGISVQVNGVTWNYTSSLLFAQSDDTVFEAQFDEFDRATITFGDGVFGAMVPEGATITVQYRVGGGKSGNIPQNSIDTTVIAFAGSQPSNPVTVFISNPYTVGRGGQDRESIEDAKRNIPRFIRSNDRGVGEDDYDSLASNFVDPSAGRIKFAKAVLNSNAVPREQNVVWIYAWVQGSNGQLAPPTMDLKTRLFEYMNRRKMIGDEIVIVDGPTTTVPVQLRYRFSKQSDASDVTSKVQVAINNVFAALLPGQPLQTAKITAAVSSLPEIEFVSVHFPNSGSVDPSNAFELFVNSLQVPSRCVLSQMSSKGDASVVVSNPDIFSVGSIISIFESGRTPTTAIVSSVTSNIVTMRTALLDNYSTSADVINSDYLPYGWAYEKPVNIYVRYTTGAGAQAAVAQAVKRAIYDYFTQTLRPEQPLVRNVLNDIVRRVPDINDVVVDIGSLDSPIEQVLPSTNEIVTLGVLSVNNAIV